jgi:hypothetical protein
MIEQAVSASRAIRPVIQAKQEKPATSTASEMLRTLRLLTPYRRDKAGGALAWRVAGALRRRRGGMTLRREWVIPSSCRPFFLSSSHVQRSSCHLPRPLV